MSKEKSGSITDNTTELTSLELKANLNPEQRAYLDVLKDKMKKILGNKTKQELAKAGDLLTLKNYRAILAEILEFLRTKEMNKNDIIEFQGREMKRSQADFLKKTANFMLRDWMFLNPEKEFSDKEVDDKQKELESKAVKFVKSIDAEGNIIRLDCSNQSISELPDLPEKLEYLNCYNNMLEKLPDLPESLVELHCDYNRLDFLPELPSGLTVLVCNGNKLTYLPVLSATLVELSCGQNFMTTLIKPGELLPIDLKKLECWDNELTELPALPDKLESLNCRDNKLVQLPDLPKNLDILECDLNPLSKGLPSLSSKLRVLSCSNCELATLPDLPAGLEVLHADDNPFSNQTVKMINAHPNSTNFQI